MLQYEKMNAVEFSGTITKNSVFKPQSGNFVKARIAIGIRKDASIFKDFVIFADKESGVIPGEALVAEGGKVVVKGKLSLEKNPRPGYEPREQIIVDEIRENRPTEVADAAPKQDATGGYVDNGLPAGIEDMLEDEKEF